jgi:hypothetical chaperone protein
MDLGDCVAIGIDFGTTNSVVALVGSSGEVESYMWPSRSGPTDVFRTALTFWREGRRITHVAGPEAIDRAIAAEGEQRFIQSIKTHLASRLFSETRLYGERFTIEKLVSIFLSHLVGKILPGVSVGTAVTSGRPVVFAGERPDEELAVTRLAKAYSDIGLPQVQFAYEPLGAAYWYARGLTRDETVLVADFGGGTSDFSVLRFTKTAQGVKAEALAHAGVGVAGDTFDYRIIDNVVAPLLGKGTTYRSFEKRLPMPAYLYAAFAQWHQLSWLKSPQTLTELKRLEAAAEEPEAIDRLSRLIELDLGFELYRSVGAVKAALSSAERADFRFAREGLDISATIARKDFEAWIKPDLAKIAEAMDKALASSKVDAEDIDAVFLTGGTSFVPAVRQLFLSRFAAERLHVGDAFRSVASGLALLAADRSRSRTDEAECGPNLTKSLNVAGQNRS